MGSDPRSDEWRYPEGDEPTPPAPAMPDGARPVRREVLAGEAAELLILRIRDAEHVAELTTLRQRLAEAERTIDRMAKGAGSVACAIAADQTKDLERRLAEAEARAEDFKRIGQGFERDMRKHFQQSCDNLQRAEKAQADAARWEGAARRYRDVLVYCEWSEDAGGKRECPACCCSHKYGHAKDCRLSAAINEIPTASAIVREGEGRP